MYQCMTDDLGMRLLGMKKPVPVVFRHYEIPKSEDTFKANTALLQSQAQQKLL